jgi:hypothetical protein
LTCSSSPPLPLAIPTVSQRKEHAYAVVDDEPAAGPAASSTGMSWPGWRHHHSSNEFAPRINATAHVKGIRYVATRSPQRHRDGRDR